MAVPNRIQESFDELQLADGREEVDFNRSSATNRQVQDETDCAPYNTSILDRIMSMQSRVYSNVARDNHSIDSTNLFNNFVSSTSNSITSNQPKFVDVKELEATFLKNLPDGENGTYADAWPNKKKPRNRRRHREKKNKKLETLDITFSIQAITSHKNYVYFKQRDLNNKGINIQSFYESCIPYFFSTKLTFGDDMASASVEETQPKIDSRLKPEGANKIEGRLSRNFTQKNKKNVVAKKEISCFPYYMTFKDVQFGLESGRLFSGVIRINPKNFKEAYVSNLDRSAQDFLIPTVVDRNRALEGDLVVLDLKPRSEWRDNQKTAYVVFIKEKIHPRTAVGFLSLFPDKNRKFAAFTPRDHRVPRMRIPSISWPDNFYKDHNNYKNVMFLGKITEWNDTRFAMGAIVSQIGRYNELIAETKALLLENDLNVQPFPPEVYQYLPKSADISDKDLENRLDFRKECVFTIDPATAKDLDDAVSCKELPNGNLEIGVHIADVSHYLKESTPLDIIVLKKATTIYLVDNVFHMLPVELCNICSLLPEKDCLTFSVIWEMTKEGQIVNEKFSRSIIRSCCQLAYEHAQMMIDDPINFNREELPEITNGFTPDNICDVVNKLQKIAVNFRNRRFENGALRIDQVKLNFRLDPATGLPSEFHVYENKAAHRLIEEFMLLANMSVAQKILDNFPDLAFLRCHEPPNSRMLCEIKNNLATIGMHLDIDTSGAIHSSLVKYGMDTSFLGECRMQVLHHLLAKPMTRARYFCSGLTRNYHHYALNADVYTHFTSPIRRYADVMVHRLLAASLGYINKPSWGSDFVNYIAEICNKQKYNAKKAGETSSEMYLAHYIEAHQPFIETAVIIDVKDKSYDVILIKTGSIIRLYLNTLEENVTYVVEQVGSSKQNRIVLTFPPVEELAQTQFVIQMFQVVQVAVTRKDKSYKLAAKLVRPDRP